METTTTYRNPFELKPHKLCRHIPAPDTRSSEWQAFVDGLQNAGPQGIPPVIITPGDLYMDGGWRILAARQLNWEEIACQVMPDSRAGAVIVETLIHRKHMSRGAAVYLVIPMLKEFLASAEDRRLDNLEKGRKTREKPLFSRFQVGRNVETNQDLCESLGVSDETLRRAVKVRELLDANSRLKKLWEPLLLSGEKNLWNVLSGIGGASTDQSGREQGVLSAQLELFADSFSHIKAAAKAWTKFKPEQRAKVLEDWVETVASLPNDLADEMVSRLQLRAAQGV